MPFARTRPFQLAALLCPAAALLAPPAPATAAPAGWKLHQGQPGKPAVLLIHGLVSSTANMMDPAKAWNLKVARFDPDVAPGAESGTAEHARVGVHGLKLSPTSARAQPSGTFWAALVARGFTVATWDQVPCTATPNPDAACQASDVYFRAYPTAVEAFRELVKSTPPGTPIALVGHSRGGLFVRSLLKEKQLPGLERVKWAVMVQAPNQGSSIPTHAAEIQRSFARAADVMEFGALPKPLRDVARKVMPDASKSVKEVLDRFVQLAGLSGAMELRAGGPLLKELDAGEVKRPGVKYVTFGGTSPRLAQLHLLGYTPDSAVPRQGQKDAKHKLFHTVYQWQTKLHRLLDVPLGFRLPYAELKPGGDGMVTDQSSRHRFEDAHFSFPVNHASMLWSREAQERLIELLR